MSSRPFHAFLNWRRQRKPLASPRSTLQFETLEPRLLLNAAPVAMIDDHSLHSNEWSQIAGWINYSDAANNPATQYEFWDGGTGADSGYFWTPDNAHQPTNTAIDVAASGLNNVWVRGGQTAGSETMWVRAFDGSNWSDWDPFTLTTLPDTKPVATIDDHSLHSNEWSQIAGWINYSNAANNPATQYEFWDDGTGADSGYFWTPDNAHQPANTAIDVAASGLNNVWVRGGQTAGSETMWVRAFDGSNWSDWDPFTLTTLPDTKPVATIDDHSLHSNEWSQIAGWINYSNAANNPATQYEFWDDGTGADSGYFWTPDNAHQPANTAIDVAASGLNNVWVRGGQTAGSETMWVRAFDGSNWSDWDPFTLTTLPDTKPVATIDDHSLHSNKSSQIAGWINYSNAANNPATQYEFWDDGTGADSGYFYTPDNARQPANTAIDVAASGLNNVWVRGGQTAGSETMWVRAFDGSNWSDWDPFTLTTLPDTTAPTVAITAPTGTLSGIVTVSANASDNVGVAGVQFYLDGALLGTEDTTTPYSVSWNTTTATNASHTLLARARDAAGNITNSAPLTVTVSNPDTTAPTVAITAPTGTLSGIVTVSANASDNVGVAGVVFSVDGVALGNEDTTSPYSITWDTTAAANGTHTLLARARDTAGNLGNSAPVTVTVSNTQTSGLAAAYAFNETSGTTAADGSGHSLTGALVNGATFAAGKYGNAVRLDGVNDYVDLGNPTALQLTGSMTISAWINTSAFPGDDAAIVSKRVGEIGFQLDTTVDTGRRTVGFKLTNSSGAAMFRFGAATLQANTWYYVTGVYDASAQTLHVYLNGQLDDGALLGTVTASQTNSTGNVNIGQRPDSPGAFNFNGLIDDVRIYSRALTQAAIQADMATAIGGGGSGTGDTEAPTVSITSPAPNAQLTGIVTITANASDNVGVAGVQFYLDGALLGTEDTTTPYSVSWNTTTATNASHTLLARARDAAGNITNSAPLTITVSNTQTTQIVGLPADRLYDWNPGLNSVGGIPNRTTVFTTVFPGGNIQAAIDAAPPGQVVQLAAGTFTVNNYLLINKGITLRGTVDPVTNAPLTFLQKTNGATAGSYTATDYQPIIIVGPSRYPQIGTSTNLTSDAVAGTYSVTLASTAGLSPGQFVILDEDDYTSASFIALPNRNGSPTSAKILASDRVVFMDHSPSDPGDDPFPDSLTWFSRANRPLNELKEIASISGNTVTFTSPITITYTVSKTAQLTSYVDTFVKYAGIENLSLKGGSDGQVRFEAAAYSWMKNVEDTLWLGDGVSINNSFRIEVRDSYIHDGAWSATRRWRVCYKSGRRVS